MEKLCLDLTISTGLFLLAGFCCCCVPFLFVPLPVPPPPIGTNRKRLAFSMDGAWRIALSPDVLLFSYDNN